MVAFGQGALTTHLPDRPTRQETIAAINRLTVAGGTSLGQAILASLTAIIGQTGQPARAGSGAPPPDLGYWRSATIVLLSDGEDTGGPDALHAAELAAAAGVHIETIGVGTVEGSTIEVDGFQVATALNEELLTEVAATTDRHLPPGRGRGGRSAPSTARSTCAPPSRTSWSSSPGAVVGIALLLLTIGGLLMINWFGRIL